MQMLKASNVLMYFNYKFEVISVDHQLVFEIYCQPKSSARDLLWVLGFQICGFRVLVSTFAVPIDLEFNILSVTVFLCHTGWSRMYLKTA